MTISGIPDLPAASQLARALWQGGSAQRGAACLIGAGFSRNASLAGEDTPPPPLWDDLERAMSRELYPDGARDAPRSPLRLAEEYRTYLGQAALDDLLRDQVRDESWRPGPLHEALLRLPWADVLTTNWDTLLERAARKIASPNYSVVRSSGDVGHARAPRITKLHGTIGAGEPLVFAEEDYRSYPTRRAPFVNLARQVFIENELVLLGFSGDDLNFLEWSGWVRDHLGGGARRIYLVGVLDLGPAKRKLLEAMNVAPIDLAPLVVTVSDTGARHRQATKLFLDFLASSAPRPLHDWRLAPPRQARTTEAEWDRQHRDDAYAASLIEAATTDWAADRKAYPGWLVCPARKREDLRHRSDDAPQLNAARLALVDPRRRLGVLHELAWRHATALWPVPRQLQALFAEAVRADGAEASGRPERLEIAALLLREARVADDEPGFREWSTYLHGRAPPEGDWRAVVAYQEALLARDRLDFGSLLKDAAAIGSGEDPAWRIRLAALHAHCGETDEAARLLVEVVNDLNERQAEDRSSIWIRSRRAWAKWLERAARTGQLRATVPAQEWPLEFAAVRADPWEEIAAVRDAAAAALRKRREEAAKIAPLFLPGHYRETSPSITFVSSTIVTPSDTLEYLTAHVGIPERIGAVGLCGDAAKDAMELAADGQVASLSWYRRWLRIVSDVSDPGIERHLGRVRIAQLDGEAVGGLLEAVSKAIDYWRARVRRGRFAEDRYDGFAVERLRFFIEVRSRLTARQDTEGARGAFDVAMDLAADLGLRHMWLREETGRLAEYAVKAMRAADRAGIALDALHFPMPSEWAPGYPGYASPVQWLVGVQPVREADDPRWTSRIARLVAETGDPDNRAEACLRLVYLADKTLLSAEELRSLSVALWSQTDRGELPLPADTRLYPHAFAALPGPEGVDVEEAVRRRLYGPTTEVGGDPFGAIYAAATGRPPMFPSREKALDVFDRLMGWEPPVDESAFHATFARAEKVRMRRDIGALLAKAIMPALDRDDLTTERGQRLLALIDEKEVHTALWALPFFMREGDETLNVEIARRIRRGLFGRGRDETFGATYAVTVWIELIQQGLQVSLPAEIVGQVLSGLETHSPRGLEPLLQIARRLVEEGLVPHDGVSRLDTALEALLVNASYDGLTVEDEISLTISLVRSECVRLAAAMERRGHASPTITAWLEAGREDPLPEVRFALETA